VGSYRLSRRAKSVIIAILARSEAEFGHAARDRYAALLFRAMQDVADDPTRLGATIDRSIDATCCFYHIGHSRTRVPTPPGRVRSPRHLLVYEIAADGVVDIIAVVPDPVPREVAVARIRRGGAVVRPKTRS
jgi:toxin ParE1/3/4